MCGGSSAKSDRTTQLFNQGQAQDVGAFLKSLGPQLTAKGGGEVTRGLADTEKASKYYSDILSGDPAKVLAAVAPEVSAISGQTGQAKQAIAAGGNRTGGTNATTQQLADKARGAVVDVIGKARPGAAAGVERTGAQISQVGLTEQGQGLAAETTAAGVFQNLINSSIQSRQVSQKIHNDAVQQWAKLVASVFAAIPTGGASVAGAAGGAGGGGFDPLSNPDIGIG